MKIFRTYNLYRFVEDYLAHSIFPNKDSWRNIVVEAINTHKIKEWRAQLLRKPGLLVNILCGNIPDLVFRAVVDCNTFYSCKLCNRNLGDISYHFIMDCSALFFERNML